MHYTSSWNGWNKHSATCCVYLVDLLQTGRFVQSLQGEVSEEVDFVGRSVSQ